jgi:hypothetical protein
VRGRTAIDGFKLEVLIRVKALGLNRSELFTRQGLSPGVVFPPVLGIEAVGLVEEAREGEFTKELAPMRLGPITTKTIIAVSTRFYRLPDQRLRSSNGIRAVISRPRSATLPLLSATKTPT